MSDSPLLESLELVDVIESNDQTTDNDEMVQLWALPEAAFHKATSSVQPNVGTFDSTGTRPYSGAKALIWFFRAFPEIFEQCDIIELGAGIGACGLLLAQQQRQQRQQKKGKIVITDGEPVAVEISKRNKKFLSETEHSNRDDFSSLVTCCPLRWSENAEEVREQLASYSENNTLKFKHVLGSDLLYYKTDPKALIATAVHLLDDKGPEDGAIFLPALIRCETLGQEVVDLAHEYELEVDTLKIKKFVPKQYLESIPGWYNLDFLILTRKGKPLQRELNEAMTKAKKCPFDPDASSSDEESSDED
jgi:hypothetical protein